MSTPTLLSAPKLLAFPLRREDVPVVRSMSQEGETLDSLPDCDDEAFKALTARGTSSYLVRSGTGEKLGAVIVTENGRQAPSVTNLVDDRFRGTYVEREIRRIQDDLACIRQSAAAGAARGLFGKIKQACGAKDVSLPILERNVQFSPPRIGRFM